VTGNDGDKLAAQGTRGLTVGDETRRSTRLAARPGELMTRGRTGYRAGTNTRKHTRQDSR